MIKYIRNLPILIKGILRAFFNYLNLHDRANGYIPCFPSNHSVLNKNFYSVSKSRFAQTTPPSVNAQRIAYWSGSSKIYRG